MRGIKIPPQDFGLKMQGGLMRGVFAGHYGIHNHKCYYDSASARGGDKCLVHVLVVFSSQGSYCSYICMD